jgi:hypothetical protein
LYLTRICPGTTLASVCDTDSAFTFGEVNGKKVGTIRVKIVIKISLRNKVANVFNPP